QHQHTFPTRRSSDLRMAISERETRGSIVVGGRLIDYLGHIRIKEARIVDAVRMLVEKNPSLSRPWKGKIGRYLDVLVNWIPRTTDRKSTRLNSSHGS